MIEINPALFLLTLLFLGWIGGKAMDWLWEYCITLERDTTVYKSCDACEYGCNWTKACSLCECHQPGAF
jgi:hypothetical protein